MHGTKNGKQQHCITCVPHKLHVFCGQSSSIGVHNNGETIEFYRKIDFLSFYFIFKYINYLIDSLTNAKYFWNF